MTSFATTAGERRIKLEAELDRYLSVLKSLRVKCVFLVGSLAQGKVHTASDIDLIIITESDERYLYLDRLERFYDALEPRVATDFFVYTPEEFAELRSWSSFVEEAMRTARVLYDAGCPRGGEALAGSGPPGS